MIQVIGNNITIDGAVYGIISESTIGNKIVSTYQDEAGIIANMILIVTPGSADGDMYIVVYRNEHDTRITKRGKLNIHCSI